MQTRSASKRAQSVTTTGSHAADPSNKRTRDELAQEAPSFTFGVLSDIQYADIDDGASYWGTPRYYRNSLKVLAQTVQEWGADEKNLSFVLHLGDILDGYCPKHQSETALQCVLSHFKPLKTQIHHVVGNHCLYNFDRSVLNQRLGIPGLKDGSSYYTFSPVPGFRLVILDTFNIGLIGWPEDSARTREAEKVLMANNINVQSKGLEKSKNDPSGMNGLKRRFVAFNGGVGSDQIDWLRGVLQESESKEERVLVCTHCPIYPEVCPPGVLAWDYEQVLEVVQSYTGTVVAVLSGHAHMDSQVVDGCGIHHRILPAVLECSPDEVAYGSIDVFSNKLTLRGVGRVATQDMPFPAKPKRTASSRASCKKA